MNFTTEEIALCKEIAEYFRKPIQKGEWFSLLCDNSPFLLDNYSFWVEGFDLYEREYERKNRIYNKDDWWPLWTWQDAREWLREKGWEINEHLDSLDIVKVEFARISDRIKLQNKGKSDLEAILKVVLEILKEEK